MGNFNNLFGDDRDIVQETGATAGQKLRVNSTDPTKLESFDLFAESTPGGFDFNTNFTFPSIGGIAQITSGVGGWFDGGTRRDSVDYTSTAAGFGDGIDYLVLGVDSLTDAEIAAILNIDEADIGPDITQNALDNSIDITVAQSSGSVTVEFTHYAIFPSGGKKLYLLPAASYSTAIPTAQISNGTGSSSFGTFTLSHTPSAPVTTVTGDLTVTGLSAGSVVSDANGNLSIGTGGVSVNTGNNTVPVSNADSTAFVDSPVTVAAGTAGSSTDDYVFTYNMSQAKWQLSNELVAAITTTALDAQIADGSSDFGLYLPSPDTVTPPSIYFNVQSAGDVPDPLATFFSFNGKDYDYTTGSGFGLSQSAGNYFISLFDNDLGSFIAGNNNDTLTMPVAQYPTAGASTPNVTTVTGNLTVTGETTLAIPTTASSVTSNTNYKFRVTDDSADVGLPGHITFIHE